MIKQKNTIIQKIYKPIGPFLRSYNIIQKIPISNTIYLMPYMYQKYIRLIPNNLTIINILFSNLKEQTNLTNNYITSIIILYLKTIYLIDLLLSFDLIFKKDIK